ncbi:hypothetical protein [Streptomyces sp. HPF1205]|uniref:T4 family baseplate hub assembly chaperone n=1 Tax=Streptomyces sp. HPF1205 TaxID=2873262 RepID=UPI001CED83E0|nr:hypothetical protein [Streptomyces sp. HPF1205]
MSPQATPAADALLATWEAGLAAGNVSRALLLHAAARPAAATAELMAVPVGQRDADLYELRAALFGDRMNVRVTCRQCAEEMEFDLAARRIAATEGASRDEFTVEHGEWNVRFRLPTTGDLAVAETAPAARAATMLAERCVLAADRAGEAVEAGQLPEDVRQRVAAAAAEADPRADVTLKVACPSCGHQAAAELDIASYLWAELDAWARGTLLDVHLLATAYGWSEPEILALSPLRRRYYLELCADA